MCCWTWTPWWRAVAAQLAAESHSGTNGRLKISQEEIASLCGVSRQRCNAALTRLARDGVLQTRYGGLTILDSEALHEHAKLKGDAAPEREPDA